MSTLINMPTKSPQTWQERFEEMEKNHGWIPEHKKRILSFIEKELSNSREEGRKEENESWYKKVESVIQDMRNAYIDFGRKEEREWIRKNIKELLIVDDGEKTGWDILKREGGACCPGDDVWTGFKTAINKVLSLLSEPK